jgi:hypothetical protein
VTVGGHVAGTFLKMNVPTSAPVQNLKTADVNKMDEISRFTFFFNLPIIFSCLFNDDHENKRTCTAQLLLLLLLPLCCATCIIMRRVLYALSVAASFPPPSWQQQQQQQKQQQCA